MILAFIAEIIIVLSKLTDTYHLNIVHYGPALSFSDKRMCCLFVEAQEKEQSASFI